ncbi:MAG: hypothetical protein V3T70_06865 [Phycisphaerae bacterium]
MRIRTLITVRCLSAIVIGGLLWLGCEPPEPALPPLAGTVTSADGQPMMPTDEPSFDPLVLGDQSTYRPPPTPDNFPLIELDIPGLTDTPDADESESTDGVPDALAASPSDEDEDWLRDAARPALAAVPDPPGPLAPDAVEAARQAALADATRWLMNRAMELPIGEDEFLFDRLGPDVVLTTATPSGVRVVGFNWLDAATLEIEVEITLSDLILVIQGVAPDADTSPLESLGLEKCLVARGEGSAPDGDDADTDA